MVSARMKPFSKSVWMTPAACGALGPSLDRPGARLLRPDGEEGDEMQKIVARADDAVEPGLAQTRRPRDSPSARPAAGRAISLSILADTTTAAAPSLAAWSFTSVRKGVAPVGRSLLDIADIEHRLRRQEAERLEKIVLLAADSRGARRPAFAQLGRGCARRAPAVPWRSLSPPLAFFSMATMRRSRLSRSASISSVSMVAMSDEGIDAAFDMGDVAVLEAAHDMGDRVAFADIGEKLVAEPFALRGAAHEARRCRRRSAGSG